MNHGENGFISRKFKDIKTGENKLFEDLLSNNISVILGEPASGKTYQLRHFKKENSEDAHFVALVNIESEKNLEQIKSKKYILLDSIDEALTDYINPKKLQKQLSEYVKNCRSQNPNIKFVFTCRQLEWNDYFKSALEELDKTLAVYQIQDLTKDEINQLLTQAKIKTDEFWEFISKNYLDFLLKNILVVFNIIANYDEYKTKELSFVDIYFDLIKEHLSVKGDDREALNSETLTRLVNVSSSLATYMLLNRKSFIFIKNPNKLTDELYEIDCKPIATKELKGILNTSLFKKDGDSFSFFHKSVQEFLMAHFINEKKLDIKTIKKLFSHELRFYEEFEEVIIYLTNLNDALFDDFVQFDPFVFKRHPNLSKEQQEKLLNSMLYKLKNDKSMAWGRWRDFEGTTLVKFDTLNLPSLIQKNIKSPDIDNIVFVYIMALLKYNYSRELEDLVFKYLEDYSKTNPSSHEKYDAISHSKFEGNKNLRELIEKNFIDNFDFNKRLFEFSKEKKLINCNSKKISDLDFETKLFESLYGIKCKNRCGNEEQVKYIDTKYDFDALLELLDGIPSRQLKYIVPYLKPKDSLKWLEHIQSKERREKYSANCWCIYAVLLHNHSKDAINQVFEFLNTHFLHLANTDIEEMPFDFKSIADNFWDLYFKYELEKPFYITSLLRLLKIQLDDIQKAVLKYPIDSYIEHYVRLRLNQDIDNYLMENNALNAYITIINEKWQKEQEKDEEEFQKELKDNEEYQQKIQKKANYEKICEDSLKALATKQDFYNVFICEETKNKGKLLELLTSEQHEKLLDFIKNDFKKDETYKKIKDTINANRFDAFFASLFIYLFENCDNETIVNLIQSKEDFEKIFFHAFRLGKIEEEYVILLANEYFEYFIEALRELIRLSLKQSQNQDIAYLYEAREVIQQIGKFDKESLPVIINYFLSLDKSIFKTIKEEHKVEEILKIISLDGQNYGFIDELKNTDSDRAFLYLYYLLQVDAKKALGDFFSKYQKVPLKIRFYKLKRLFWYKKSDKEKKNRYDKPFINPRKIQFFKEVISALKKIKSIELPEKQYIEIILNDYHRLFYEYKHPIGTYSPNIYDDIYEYVSYLWNSLGADSSHIALLQKLSKSKCKSLSTRAKHHLNEAYNHQNKDRCYPNTYYKKIFDNENAVDVSRITKFWEELTMPVKIIVGVIGFIGSIASIYGVFLSTSSSSDTINATNNNQSQIIQNNQGNITIHIDNSKNEMADNIQIGDNINKLLRENQKNIIQGNHNQEEQTKLNSEAFILGKSLDINKQNMTIVEKNKECKNQANMVANYMKHDLNLMYEVCDNLFQLE